MNLEVFATHAEQKVRPITSGNRFGNSILSLVSVNSENFRKNCISRFFYLRIISEFLNSRMILV